MVILHIVNLSNKRANGINVVVPQHVLYQSKYAQVALLNLNKIDYKLEEINYFYNGEVSDSIIKELDSPFNKPDLIIFHGIFLFNYTKLYKILLSHNIPYIVVPHGSLTYVALRKKRIKKYVALKMFFNSFINNASAIQFLSNGEKNNSLLSFKGFVNPNGISLLERKRPDKSWNGIRILFIGRKEYKIKGLDLLLMAVKEKLSFFKKSNAKIYIHGPGDGDSENKINSFIKKYNIDETVFNLEAIYGKEKHSKLLECDIFIHTSRSEGLPTAVLEAMSYKLPVFVTKGTGIAEDIEKYQCGWIAENNAESVAKQLEKMIVEKDLFQEYGENAYNYVKSKYDWDKISKEAIEEYRKIINDIRGKQ